MLSGLYGISDEILTPYGSIFEKLKLAIDGGLKVFQLRDKTHKDLEIENLVLELNDFCLQNNVLFVLNDRIELAINTNCSGLHIGRDAPISEVRESFGGILGVSCYGDLELGRIAQSRGVDYLAFGCVFRSSTKPNAPLIGSDFFKKVSFEIPVCAIGGINKDNVASIVGVDMIAVIKSLWEGDVYKNAVGLREGMYGGKLHTN